MSEYIFTNLIGSFVIDEKNSIVDKILFNSLEDYKNREKTENQLKQKHPKSISDKKILPDILSIFKDRQYLEQFRQFNLILTKEKIKAAVNEDNLISQAMNSIRETDKIANILVKRLREWYSLSLPELSEVISDNEKFAEIVLKKSREELIEELKVTQTMGAELAPVDLEFIKKLAEEIILLYENRQNTITYLGKIMDKYCSNLKEIAGITIGAKLIEHVGSLKRLAMLPSSTLQILGAEKALFRHIKTGARPPKYGLIFDHQFIQKARREEQGKRARALADKLTIAARIDYFHGEFIGDKLKRELEEKFK